METPLETCLKSQNFVVFASSFAFCFSSCYLLRWCPWSLSYQYCSRYMKAQISFASSRWGLFRYCYPLTFECSGKVKNSSLWICMHSVHLHSLWPVSDRLILIEASLWPIRISASQIALSVEMLIAPIKGSIVWDSKVPVKCWVPPFCAAVKKQPWCVMLIPFSLLKCAWDLQPAYAFPDRTRLCSARLNPSSSLLSLCCTCPSIHGPPWNNQLSKSALRPCKGVSNLISLIYILCLLVHSFQDSCVRQGYGCSLPLKVSKCWAKISAPVEWYQQRIWPWASNRSTRENAVQSRDPSSPRPSYKHSNTTYPALLKWGGCLDASTNKKKKSNSGNRLYGDKWDLANSLAWTIWCFPISNL